MINTHLMVGMGRVKDFQADVVLVKDFQADVVLVKDNQVDVVLVKDNQAGVVLVKDIQADMVMAVDIKMGMAMIPKDLSIMMAPVIKGDVMRSMAMAAMVRVEDMNHMVMVRAEDMSHMAMVQAEDMNHMVMVVDINLIREVIRLPRSDAACSGITYLIPSPT